MHKNHDHFMNFGYSSALRKPIKSKINDLMGLTQNRILKMSDLRAYPKRRTKPEISDGRGERIEVAVEVGVRHGVAGAETR